MRRGVGDRLLQDIAVPPAQRRGTKWWPLARDDRKSPHLARSEAALGAGGRSCGTHSDQIWFLPDKHLPDRVPEASLPIPG